MKSKIDPKVILFGLVAGACILPVVILLRAIGRPELDYPVMASSAAIAFVVRGRWDLRGRWWFWATIAAVVGLHTVLIVLIPWNAGWVPAPVTMLACIADLALLYFIIGAVDKM